MEVAPASELPLMAMQRGAKLMIVNYDTTPWDTNAEVILRADAAKVLPHIAALALANAGDFQ
jgi:NAD-dependent deacetylase